jgi:hypothetical protein
LGFGRADDVKLNVMFGNELINQPTVMVLFMHNLFAEVTILDDTVDLLVCGSWRLAEAERK